MIQQQQQYSSGSVDDRHPYLTILNSDNSYIFQQRSSSSRGSTSVSYDIFRDPILFDGYHHDGSQAMSQEIPQATLTTKNDSAGTVSYAMSSSSSFSSSSDVGPLDVRIWGPKAWEFMHAVTFAYPVENPTHEEQENMRNFFHAIGSNLPCDKCRYHFLKMLKEHPVPVQSRRELSEWLVDRHNDVNRRLGKPIYPYSFVEKKYIDMGTLCPYNNDDDDDSYSSPNDSAAAADAAEVVEEKVIDKEESPSAEKQKEPTKKEQEAKNQFPWYFILLLVLFGIVVLIVFFALLYGLVTSPNV